MHIKPLHPIWFYCDESSHDGGKYLAIAGIAMHGRRRDIITDEFQKIKKAGHIRETSEMKWSRVDKKYLPAYKSAVDYFFQLLNDNHIHFHCMLAERAKLKYRFDGNGTKLTSISKLYYQLIKHRCCRYYGAQSLIHVRPDNGDCTSYLPRILSGINNDARNTFGLKHAPIVSIDCKDSKSEPLLQLNDIVLGGISSHRNERFLTDGASPSKTELANYILEKFGWSDYSTDTAINARKITLWHMRS